MRLPKRPGGLEFLLPGISPASDSWGFCHGIGGGLRKRPGRPQEGGRGIQDLFGQAGDRPLEDR